MCDDLKLTRHPYENRTLLENLAVAQLVNKFQAFYGTWRFFTIFIRARHWSIIWAKYIQSTPCHPISLWSILILFFYLRLRLPSCLFSSGFPTNILCTFFISPTRATYPVHLTPLDFITIIIFGEAYKSAETLLSYHITTRRHNPKELNLNLHRRENLKSLMCGSILSSWISGFWKVGKWNPSSMKERKWDILPCRN